MGYIRHHTIIIHCNIEGKIQSLKDFLAVGYGDKLVFGPFQSPINGTETLIVIPDGSKEGWEDSDRGDAFREFVATTIKGFAYEDGSSPFHYVELISYDEDGPAEILRQN